MHWVEMVQDHRAEVEQKLGYLFSDFSYLILALTHRSFVNENRKMTEQHNERLEFLGDSILGFLISDLLYRHFPKENEGRLSEQKARLIDATACVAYMQKLGIASYVLMGKGEQTNEGKARDSILADVFEALIGAIYLDGGIQKVKTFFFDNFQNQVHELLERPLQNWKAELQDVVQKLYHLQPEYVVTHEEGPDHAKTFHIVVKVEGREIGSGSGCTKKMAQQEAAQNALSKGVL
jgi:ribonuclease-3